MATLTGSSGSILDRIKGDESALRTVLQALGCHDTIASWGSRQHSQLVTCPMPDHADEDPSASPFVEGASFTCHSRCGFVSLGPLVVACGAASDMASAMRWLEDLFGVERAASSRPTQDVVLDPSLTVADYAYQLGLCADTVRLFGLEDVLVHHSNVKESARKYVGYEDGWYPSVFMPYGEGRSPRVRSERPDRKNWNAQTVKFPNRPGAPKIAFAKQNLPQGAFGTAAAVDNMDRSGLASATKFLVVEGESDVLCLHDEGLQDAIVVGVPGVNSCTAAAVDIVALMRYLAAGDEPHINLGHMTVITMAEPGAAGQSFPRKVRAAIEAECQRLDPAAGGPGFDSLQWTSLPGEPTDGKDFVLAVRNLPDRERSRAFGQLGRAIHAAHLKARGLVPSPSLAPSDESVPALTPIELAAQSIDPDRDDAPVDPAALAHVDPQSFPESDPWKHLLGRGAPQVDPLTLPTSVLILGSEFFRSSEGWSQTKYDEKGNAKSSPICGPLLIERAEECEGQKYLRAAVNLGGRWESRRIPMSRTAEPAKLAADLSGIGLTIASSRRPQVADLVTGLMQRNAHLGRILRVPHGTGWLAAPGGEEGGSGSMFGGIDVEPVAEEPAKMYEANRRRRRQHPDRELSAQRWWDRGVAPFLQNGEESPPSVVLALGAAAAAPLLAPLTTRGVGIGPVTWLTGLGGGGKTTLQTLSASIFAPSRADIDGSECYSTNADMTRAALTAHALLARDLPLILDDVMQIPALAGTSSRAGTDAARIEAAAQLAMMIFNRKSAKRSNPGLTLTKTHPFRSTAVLSAEVSLESQFAGAKASAGQHRRIQTIDTRPLDEAGLTGKHAEDVVRLSMDLGGSAGDLLIDRIRVLVESDEMRTQIRESIQAVKDLDIGLESTQRQALAVNLLGFTLLAEVCGRSAIGGLSARSLALSLIKRYASHGGVTPESLENLDRLLNEVRDMYGTNPLKFVPDEVTSAELGALGEHVFDGHRRGSWGRLVRMRKEPHQGRQGIALTSQGMEVLKSRPGVTGAMIEAAIARDICVPGHRVRMWGNALVPSHVFFAVDDEPDDLDYDDDDPSPQPFDHDPHNLREEPTAEELDIIEHFAPEAEPDSQPDPDIPTEPEEIYTEPEAPASDEPEILRLPRIAAGLADHGFELFEGDYVFTASWQWSTGTYRGNDCPQLREHIHDEAVHELHSTIEVLKESQDLVLGSLPESSNPAWAQLEAFGAAKARGLWTEAGQLLQQALVPDIPADERRELMLRYGKKYRLHVLARVRRPEWFIDEPA